MERNPSSSWLSLELKPFFIGYSVWLEGLLEEESLVATNIKDYGG